MSFHHHEVVGARMTRTRMEALRYSAADVDTVVRLVELHLRFHTYRLGWTDKAVRRYVRDAGPHLDLLNELTRCDCTTRNAAKARALARRMDELEARIVELGEQEELQALRPDLDGNQIMELLGIGPGRAVGQALDFLMELRLDEGPLGEEEAAARLRAWWAAAAVSARGGSVAGHDEDCGTRERHGRAHRLGAAAPGHGGGHGEAVGGGLRQLAAPGARA